VDTTTGSINGSVCSSDTVPVAQSASTAAAVHQLGQDEASMTGRRRVVVVPVSTTGRSLSPPVRTTDPSAKAWRTPWSGSGIAETERKEPPSGGNSNENMSSEERQRYLAEINSLRRENSSLREEVIDSREQALRQLRSNAERALRQQTGPSSGTAEAAEGPVVAAATAAAPAAPLRAGFQRSTSPMPPGARLHVAPQVVHQATATSRAATPGRARVAMPGGVGTFSPPPAVEAAGHRPTASSPLRRSVQQLPRNSGAISAREAAEGWHSSEAAGVATARIASNGPSSEVPRPW